MEITDLEERERMSLVLNQLPKEMIQKSCGNPNKSFGPKLLSKLSGVDLDKCKEFFRSLHVEIEINEDLFELPDDDSLI